MVARCKFFFSLGIGKLIYFYRGELQRTHNFVSVIDRTPLHFAPVTPSPTEPDALQPRLGIYGPMGYIGVLLSYALCVFSSEEFTVLRAYISRWRAVLRTRCKTLYRV